MLGRIFVRDTLFEISKIEVGTTENSFFPSCKKRRIIPQETKLTKNLQKMRKIYPAIVFWKQDLAHNVAGPKHLNLTSWLTCFENRRNISQREVIVTSKALINLLTNAQHSSWRGKGYYRFKGNCGGRISFVHLAREIIHFSQQRLITISFTQKTCFSLLYFVARNYWWSFLMEKWRCSETIESFGIRMKIMVLLLSMKRKNYIRKRYKFKENLKKKPKNKHTS